MQLGGITEFRAFCRDELWDLDTIQTGRVVGIGIDPLDPRYAKLVEFLQDVAVEAGVAGIEAHDYGIWVTFDDCGAIHPSKVFQVRSAFGNPDHLAAALRRQARDERQFLGMHADQGQSFTPKLIHPAVRRIQVGLLEAGYRVPLDGRWNWKTRLGLWRYRRRHHLRTPKFITHETLEALEV